MKNRNINLLVWILSIISAIGFLRSGIANFWSMFCNIFFCGMFSILLTFLKKIEV